ncbi:hypothetical protein LSH36_515g02043, partial [Paralvinella palmiformis]
LLPEPIHNTIYFQYLLTLSVSRINGLVVY